ncbi:MAG: hypothetical protein ACO1SX_12440 [Actinomycetota bacterium]
MKSNRVELVGGRAKKAEAFKLQADRRRTSTPPSRSPVIPGIESEADWLDHRADVIRGLAPAGPAEEALAEDIARVLWQQRRTLRLTQHLRGIVSRERSLGAASTPAQAVNVTRLEKLEALCAELDRRLVAAYQRYDSRGALIPDATPEEPPYGAGSNGKRQATRPRRNHPYQRPR